MDPTTILRYQKENQQQGEGKVVFTGSSLMEQFPVEDWTNGMILNRGWSGATSDAFLSAIDTLIFDLMPKQIVLNIGSNDFNQADYQLDHLLANYQQILNQIKQKLPESQVTFLAFYPVCESKMHDLAQTQPWLTDILPYRTNAKIAEANVAIKSLMKPYDYQTIDVNFLLSDEKGHLKREWTIDGIHLYEKAYRILWEELKKTFHP